MAAATRSRPAGSCAIARRPRRRRAFRNFIRLCSDAGTGRVLALALIGLCGALFLNIRLAPGAATATPEPQPSVAEQWVEIAQPTPIFALQSPRFDQAPVSYEARRAAVDGSRRDTLSFGRFGAGGPYLTVSIDQMAAEPARHEQFFVIAARRAGDAALAVIRSGQPALLQTRIGAFEVADIVLANASRQERCLAFRLDHVRLRIAGLACGGDRPLEPSDLARSLDGLTLAAPNGDRQLAQTFGPAASAPAVVEQPTRPKRHDRRKKQI